MIRVLNEQHEAPPEVRRILRIAGGANPWGEPNYRFVWGYSRLSWIGGKWEDRDSEGNLIREVVELRQEPKYPALNRWHLERWLPPAAYGSPETWYRVTTERENGISIPALGPYPERGEYEHCFTLEGPNGEFVQLTPTVARFVASAIETSRLAPTSKRREAVNQRVEREERDYDSFADAVLSDAGPALYGQPFVTVA